jgi:hypothetical protein
MDHRLSLNTGDSNPHRAREEHLRGAAFIDPCCFLIRLMARPVMMQRRPSCGRRNATEGPRLRPRHRPVAAANAACFAEIAEQGPQPQKMTLVTVTAEWARYRSCGS